jgi:benzaldehyde dehydrogenase (NAD)
VLAQVTESTPAFQQEIFGPVAPVISFATPQEAVRLASSTEYGLSLGILGGDLDTALALAEQIPSGLVHINDQTVDDEATAPFGGVGASGNGTRFGGGAANLEAFTETQWLTLQGSITPYPFSVLLPAAYYSAAGSAYRRKKVPSGSWKPRV